MIIDVHNHVGLSRAGTLGEIEELISIMDEVGIDISVLFTIDEKDSGETYEPQNQKIADHVQKYPNRIVGVCRIKPKAGSRAIEEMISSHKKGLKGLKLHPKSDDFMPQDAEPAIQKAQELSWPIVIHTEHHPTSQPRLWEPFFKKYSKTPFLLTHGGKDDWAEAGRIAKALPNVYLDTSTLSYNRTRMLLDLTGAEKIAFGSDYPYSHPELEKRKFELLIQDANKLKKVFSENPKKIFKF